jgi:S-adenosylmethionine:tRNA ribosyltransferase-isomerase
MEKVRYTKQDFYYHLPEELIAQTPANPRDSSRLLVYKTGEKKIEDRIFHDIVDYLNEGDLLVVNNTKVLPARMFARTMHGGLVEVLLLKRFDLNTWEVLMRPGKKGKIGAKMIISEELSLTVKDITPTGERVVEFAFEGAFEDVLSRVGTMPLPPYIKQKLEDQARYNTVYSKIDGSAAAPTAGLHFTPELLKKIKDKGVDIAGPDVHVDVFYALVRAGVKLGDIFDFQHLFILRVHFFINFDAESLVPAACAGEVSCAQGVPGKKHFHPAGRENLMARGTDVVHVSDVIIRNQHNSDEKYGNI